jgi:hypothetical protein
MTTNPNRFGFLQVRQMVVASDMVDINDDEFLDESALVSSTSVVGNGVNNQIQDIIYVRPDTFESRHTRKISLDLASYNDRLTASGKPYLLIAIGRLGTTDPWLGIPINWGKISGAKVIVEAAQQNFKVELSQGSHYFHNLTSLGVSYFSVRTDRNERIDWEWLNNQETISETEFIRHIKLCGPLLVKVDGRTGKGVILKYCE